MSVPTGPLRAAVVGLGVWGIEHVKAWQGVAGTQLVAVCDVDAERARTTAAEFHINDWYTSAHEMARGSRLDIVSVANDERDRSAAVLPCLTAGIHAVVEKPMALTEDEAQQFIHAAESAGVFLMPGHLLRFEPRLSLLREEVGNARLGELRGLYARRLLPKTSLGKYARTHPALIATIHDLDLARWYFEAEPCSVRAYCAWDEHLAVPDVLWAVVQFPGGRIAVTETAWVLPDEARLWLEAELELIGSAGVARVHFPGDILGLYLSSGYERPDTTIAAHALGQPFGALKDQLAYFASCVASGEKPRRLTPEDGLESLKLALRVATSAATGEAVDIASQQTSGRDGSR